MLSGNFAGMTVSTPFRDLLHAAKLRHGTSGFISPSKEGVLRIFSPLKNPTDLAGFEPANLGIKGQHATPRLPKPIPSYTYMNFTSINFAHTSPKNFGLHSSLLGEVNDEFL